MINNKKTKKLEDISSSDLIYKTKILLMKTNKSKNENVDNVATREYKNTNFVDNVSKEYLNNLSGSKYKHRYNDLNLDSKYKSHLDRNISSNIRDLKINSALLDDKSKFTNFNYQKKHERTIYDIYKQKVINSSNEKIIKEYSNFKENNLSKIDYKDFNKSNNMDNLFNQEIIKKKIDREIYSRQKFNYVHLGSGNNSKEYNYISSNQGDYNDLLNKLSAKQVDSKRGTHYDYKSKESFLY
jgi:hypothetical protein